MKLWEREASKTVLLEVDAIDLHVLINALRALEFDESDPAYHRSENFRREMCATLERVHRTVV